MEDTSTNEIVTLQIGSQANYLGTHFWNTQLHYLCQENSPIDARINWKERLDTDGQGTYSPRVLIYDLKSKFGALRRGNEAFQEVTGPRHDEHRSGEDSGQANVVTQNEPPIPVHRYVQQLSERDHPDPIREGEVSSWSDYNRVFYHPTSLHPISDNLVEPDERNFKTWAAGQNLFSNLERDGVNVYDDHLRPLLEDCNGLQGLQLISSVDDGWCGFTADYWDAVRDEVGKKQFWLWALNQHQEEHITRLKRMNQARALAHFRELVDLYIPMVDKPETVNDLDGSGDLISCGDSTWSYSGIQASIFDTTTLPTCLRRGSSGTQASMAEIAQNLHLTGRRNIIEPKLSTKKSDLFNDINLCAAENQCNIIGHGWDLYAHVEVFRGGHERPSNESFMPNLDGSRGHVKFYHTDLLFPVLSSFPDLFRTGYTTPVSEAKFSGVLQTSSLPARWVKELRPEALGYLKGTVRDEVCEHLRQVYDDYEGMEDIEVREEEEEDDV